MDLACIGAGTPICKGAAISQTTGRGFRTTLRRLIRPLLLAAFALLLAGLIAPLINATRFSGTIKRAIESSLGRKVEFEKAYFTLFSGPGFSLEKVIISEDPRYGIEPFAYVPEVQARLRLDKLLSGEIRFTSLRLVNPSLNLVKSNEGSWNVVALIQRLSAPRHSPLNLFPALEVADGRVDFKLGLRKTTLYISEADLSIYPERSGKVYVRFSGSPARTDRAGMGFGHLRADVNWYRNAASNHGNQVQAEVFLDPSNLSELTTLLEGHDAGVHGTISSRLEVEGPATDLTVQGEMRLNDVHRWDLLPASGEEWTVHYGGHVDLVSQHIDLRTLPGTPGQPAPIAMHLRVNDFQSHADASVVAELKNVQLSDLLPLAVRLGLSLPNGADLHGMVNGAIGYSNGGGWSGGLAITDGAATLSDGPALRANAAEMTVNGEHVHFEPTVIEAGSGTLKMGGDYFVSNQRASALLSATDVPLDEFKPLANSWLGGLGPLSTMSAGRISGQFTYDYKGNSPDQAPASWSGQFAVNDSVIRLPGLSAPIESAHARVNFNRTSLEVDRLTGTVRGQALRASYRFNALAKRTERAHIELPRADIPQLEAALASANQSGNFWARLGFGRRSLLSWLSKRNLEGDLVVDQLFAGERRLGVLSSHFICQGPTLEFSNLALKLAKGSLDASGTIDLASYDPQWRFSVKASEYPWNGGALSADGNFSSHGVGKDLLRNAAAAGGFTGENLSLTPNSRFDSVAGLFRFSFSEGWPDLRLSDIQAVQNGNEWTGEGLTQSDWKLLVNLAHAGQQMHLVSSLAGDNPTVPLSTLPRTGESQPALRTGLKF